MDADLIEQIRLSVWHAYVQNRAHDGYAMTSIIIESDGRMYINEGGMLIRVRRIIKRR